MSGDMAFRADKNFYSSIAKLLLICFLLLAIFFSCQKERSCENCQTKNKPPVANAGLDQIITLPKDSSILDGRLSTDPDGVIVNFKWIKISGPSIINIVYPNDS